MFAIFLVLKLNKMNSFINGIFISKPKTLKKMFVIKTPEQIEDKSCRNFECEDITSQTEKKDTSFQNVQQDEPRALTECLR